MKIKRQLSLLILGMIVIPIITSVLVPFVLYRTSYRTSLMYDYGKFNDKMELHFSDSDLTEIKNFISQVPNDVQVAVIYNRRVLISNFLELKEKSNISSADLFHLMQSTKQNYDYQLHSLKIIQDGSLVAEGEKQNDSGYMICRFQNSKKHRISFTIKLSISLTLLIILMELILIIFVTAMTRGIFNSVVRIKEATENIVMGDMETPMDTCLCNKYEAEEVSSLIENLETMRVSLKDSKERRTRFIMGISHDLRTPISLIKGYSEAIEDGLITGEEIKKSADLINTNAERLESMVNDLINYVKLNNYEFKNRLEDREIKPILNSLYSNMKFGAELCKRNVEGTIDIPDGKKLKMDENLFSRAIENLFSNSLRYTNEGDSIFFKAYENQEGKVIISIIDTGIGIPKKDQKKVYELFYRGTQSRREEGMGIGLAVVKSIIELHGWNIDMKSEINKGTEFIITAG